MFTLAEENYLKNIFHLQQLSPQGVSTNAIAEKLETKPSSATDMVQKLAEKEVLTYIKYKGTTLTENGRKIAANIIRKHRLWEVFLVEKLNFQWDEVHEIAEQLEHIHSEDLISRLDKFLEYPSVDPHGDPIPDSNGNFKKTEKKLLSKLSKNEKGICVGVKESASDFLKYLDKRHIGIGVEISVLEKDDFDDSMTIQVLDETYFITKKIAENLYVQMS
ncbi:metal-dependent transcriptional regulator [Aureisphaera sp. CAU 1614]|uniref:Transcriptional regulator MntR n=1 Tax=Halomarinibacterium sedimenti TaxID=2857106 RepID=A0A9X1FM48_9FLAO|nr:metal-dependent transcriptional regulator [Halomarinibacterium sedimenti]MAL60416.1 iron-dependent repressor [Flavobacteriaceae bacterium]MBW2937153.1 metal-dependent transcriptional regulator [Halomarinibacterium sedimenti]|tara:strand:+ start:454 stop:1110 length:657 start_codon:yes stop_codon:yes gene_type:complete